MRRSHEEAARLLLESGADPNEVEDDCSVLEIALQACHDDFALILLARGARPEGVGFSRPLSLAARRGKLGVMRALLDAGADPNGANAYGDTALMTAAAYGQVAAAEVLKQAGAHLDARETRVGWTALMEAAREGRLEMARWLVSAGADIRLTDTEGKNALTLALERAQDETASYLREAGAPDQPEFAESTERAREEAAAEARAQVERVAALSADFGDARPGTVIDGPFKNFSGLARVREDGSLSARVEIFGRAVDIVLNASAFVFD
jgi:ankyrin repeat protein